MARKDFSIYDMDGMTNDELIAVACRKGPYKRELDNLEPYDPDYLSDKPYEIPEIPSEERRFLHKVGIVESKLRRNRIPYEWMEDHGMFRIGKKRQGDDGQVSGYLTYQYVAVYMDTNEYAFGGWEEDVCVSTRISAVIACVKEWLSNNEPGAR